MSIVGSEQWMYSSGREFYDFPIEQSLRFNRADSAKLTRTAVSPTLGTKATWSFWIKKCDVVSDTSSSYRTVFYCGTPNVDGFRIGFARYSGNNHVLHISQDNGSSAAHIFMRTEAALRDTSAWYNFVIRYDSTDATAADRIKVYINGELASIQSSPRTNPPLNHIPKWQVSGASLIIGDGYTGYSEAIDMYLADVNFIDGQALDPTSFGETKSGIWIPKDTADLTFGTNGFRLEYADSAAIGDDTSGNTNDWTVNNLVASDVVLDSPTNNFAVLALVNNPTDNYSEGRLKFQGLTSATSPFSTSVLGTFGVSSGKWYYEARANTRSNGVTIGFAREGLMPADGSIPTYKVFGFDIFDNIVTTNNSNTNDFTVTGASGDILGLAIDIDNGTASAYINGTLKGSVTGLNTSGYHNLPYATLGWASGGQTMTMNFGQDSTFAGTETAGGNTDENGYGDFKYAPPSGFLSLCSANLPQGAIDTLADETPEDYFSTVLWSGNGSTQSITAVNFQPDFTWIKNRSSASYNHHLVDAVRGVSLRLISNGTQADGASFITSFDSDGFSLNSNSTVNGSSFNYVGWNWKANGSGVSNTDGSITSTVSVGATSQQNWFSIVSYTGNGTAGATVGHGLGVTPDWVVVKDRDNGSTQWVHNPFGAYGSNQYIYFDTQGITADSNIFWNGNPNSTTIGLDDHPETNGSGTNYIAYCFANAEGLCKVGKFSGNGSTTDGAFVYLGFRPAFLLYKQTPTAANWEIIDNTRNPYNVSDARLFPSSSSAESTSETVVDLLSNGFKARDAYGGWNFSGQEYIYLAIAEQPFKYANAR